MTCSKKCKKINAQMVHYGLTFEEHKILFSDPFCRICGREGHHIDHDHKTGKVRGLLCRACNPAIGAMQDNPELLRRAALYVEGELA